MRRRQIPRVLAALAVIVLGGTADRARGTAVRPARHSTPPPLDGSLWLNLSHLRSYHVDSTLDYAAAGVSESLRWSEDAHGADYHLRETIRVAVAGVPGATSAPATSVPASDLYYVGGHLYVDVAGHLTDYGALGTQAAAPVLAATVGYWAGLGRTGRDAHYVGPVRVAGRPADRYTVRWSVTIPATPGAAGLPGTGRPGDAYFTNTVDVDRATRAPLHVAGAYRGRYGTTESRLTTTFSVTHIGSVGVIKVPVAAR